MGRNLNSKEFPEETKLKLEIFSECFKEWLPVFIKHHIIKKIYIFDFFAGSGSDSIGNSGSPLLLLKVSSLFCKLIEENNKEIVLSFNEKILSKYELLKSSVENYFNSCKINKCGNKDCHFIYNITRGDFKEIFNETNNIRIFEDNSFAKFILLDQYGFKEIDENIFSKLVSFPKTDFIFFISSSFIKRFKEHPSTIKYINTNQIDFSEKNPKECHRIIAEYYEKLLPIDKEYYIHHFTINKGANYWGLIFGTSHTLGMEKFLKVCWEKDKLAGESNCNINNDFEEDELFYTKQTNKIARVKLEIEQNILAHKINNNREGLRFALKKRCLPRIFTEVVKDLYKTRKIILTGDVNYQSSKIHRAPIYHIEVLKNETH